MNHVDLAARILDRVRAEAGPGAAAEVAIEDVTFALTRFANSFIHQNMLDSSATVRLRLHVDGRTASGSTTRSDDAGLAALVARTVAAARLCPPDPQWPGLAPPAPVRPAPAVDPATAHAEPVDRAARVRAFVESAGGLETAGYCSTVRTELTFANSVGQVARAVTAEAAIDAIARRPGADGVARLASRRLADIDGAVLGARAAAKVQASADPIELAAGRYEVVLEPTATLDVLRQMTAYGFNGKVHNERRSFVELGVAQLDPAITLVDDPAGPTAALPFDVEGTPRGRVTFVERGICRTVAHDRRSAAEAGTASTGHAVPGGASTGAAPPNVELLPAAQSDSPGGDRRAALAAEADGPAADAAVAELVAGVRRGLLVTDYWYTRVLDPRPLVVTGLTRNGVWLIENGEIGPAVQNLRFTQSYPQALGVGAVLGVGRHAMAVPAGRGSLTAPALRLASWNFTGNPSG
jgi:predicted Zn-dependent protease